MKPRPVGVILLLVLAILEAPRAGDAQPMRRVPTIGVLAEGFPASEAQRRQSPFWQAMHELGWVEGQNITVERRFAEGHSERLGGLATELVQLLVDVILAIGPREARAAKAASDTIPIVFMNAGDPVRFGLVASFAHTGGNLTGLSIVSPELSEKRLNQSTGDSYTRLHRHGDITRLHGLPSVPMSCGSI
jgi:putative tryptophan/tyrosine transport system substrate-binding protein